MFADVSPSEFDHAADTAHRLRAVRVDGGIDVRLSAAHGRTFVSSARERDGWKVRVPRRRDVVEAAVINTGGGIVAGDRVRISVAAHCDARAVISTPAAERVYGSPTITAAADLAVSLTLGAGASLAWLPQETILFDGARLRRQFTADLAADARLLVAETMILGRPARGERMSSGSIVDHWRIRRAGTLAYADTIRLSGDIAATMAEPAIGADATAVTTLMLVAPDAESRIAMVRERAQDAVTDAAATVGASAWNGLLIVRALAKTGAAAKAIVMAVVPFLGDGTVPRAWSC